MMRGALARRTRAQSALWFFAHVWIAIATLGACADDDDGLDELPCDIRHASCRRMVFATTAHVRGQWPAAWPPSRIITRAKFADETRAAIAQSMSSRADRVLDVSLRLLRFLPPGGSSEEAMAASDIDGVAAYYDSELRAVTIIEDVVTDVEEGTNTLSHEYVHALQDQREGFDNLWRDVVTTDQGQAVTSLVEGEAMVLSEVVSSQAAGSVYDATYAGRFLDHLQSSVLDDVTGSDAPLTEALLVMPYPVGARTLSDTFLASGIAGIQAFYGHTPRTFLGWVEPARADQLPEALSCEAPDAPLGYEGTGLDTLGSTGLMVLYTRLGLDGPASFAAARAWTNDSYAVFAPKGSDAAAALVWRLRLRDELSASDLEGKLRTTMPELAVVRSASELVLSSASDPQVLEAWTTRNDCSSSKSRAPRAPSLPYLGRFLRTLVQPRLFSAEGTRSPRPAGSEEPKRCRGRDSNPHAVASRRF